MRVRGGGLGAPTLTSSAAIAGCSAWKLPTASARQSASSQMVQTVCLVEVGVGVRARVSGLGLGLAAGWCTATAAARRSKRRDLAHGRAATGGSGPG
eukprot:scaffold31953_cov43-Phaeocystis_antarctica.AAC.4